MIVGKSLFRNQWLALSTNRCSCPNFGPSFGCPRFDKKVHCVRRIGRMLQHALWFRICRVRSQGIISGSPPFTSFTSRTANWTKLVFTKVHPHTRPQQSLAKPLRQNAKLESPNSKSKERYKARVRHIVFRQTLCTNHAQAPCCSFMLSTLHKKCCLHAHIVQTSWSDRQAKGSIWWQHVTTI
jgi:hypothetical protein